MSDVIEELVEREYAFAFHSDLHTDGRVIAAATERAAARRRRVSIIAGGLTAAVTGPTSWNAVHGSAPIPGVRHRRRPGRPRGRADAGSSDAVR